MSVQADAGSGREPVTEPWTPTALAAIDTLLADDGQTSEKTVMLLVDVIEGLFNGLFAVGAPRPEGMQAQTADGAAAEDDRPTALGRALARLAPHLPEQSRADLRAMLASRLGNDSAQTRRAKQVGLLVELIDKDEGAEIPLEREYVALLEQRKAMGESWPSPSELRRDLGGNQDRAVQEQWTRVCVVAWQVLYKRPVTKLSADERHRRYPKRPYVLSELIDAVCKFRRAVGFWPTLWEYLAWAEIQRRKERRKIVDVDPRLPSQASTYRLMKQWDADWPQIQAWSRGWAQEGELPEGADKRHPG